MGDMDISNIADILQRSSQLFYDNGCPIQFVMATAERIPKEFIADIDTDRLEATWGVFGPSDVTIFFGDLQGLGKGGMATLPQEGDMNRPVVYIDNTWSNLFMSGLTMESSMTHELGHWLGLHHTFDNDCYPGDYVIDTPPAHSDPRLTQQSYLWINVFDINIGYNTPNTCGFANDQIDNIMDYTYVKTKFTPGQVYRMMIFAFNKLVGRMPQYENGIIV